MISANLSEVERSQLRKKALAWLQKGKALAMENATLFRLLTYRTWTNPDFAPVRDPEAIAKLPPEERAEWTRFWEELPKKREVAPPPRSVKQ